jgi:N-acetylglutamate synthase-like GNAT family acetyltransferase
MLFLLFHRLAFIYFLRWTISELSTISVKYFNSTTRSHFWVAVLNTAEYDRSTANGETCNGDKLNCKSIDGCSESNDEHESPRCHQLTLLATDEEQSRYLTSKKYAKYDLFSPFSFLSKWFDFLTGGIAACTKSELDMLHLATGMSIPLEKSTIIGCIGCTAINETTCEFRFVSAHPRLKQSILFSHMILTAEAFARAKNYRRVIMYVLHARTDLKDVLTKLQFNLVPQSEKRWVTLSHWASTSIISVDVFEKRLN